MDESRKIPRRTFVKAAVVAGVGAPLVAAPVSALTGRRATRPPGEPRSPGATPGPIFADAGAAPTLRVRSDGSYDPWLEVDPDALLHNAVRAGELAGGRPVLGVIKNNGYGLGIRHVGTVLDRAPEIHTLAVVTAQEAMELRDAGVRKPILLMAAADPSTEEELVARDVHLAPFQDDAPRRLEALAGRRGAPIPVHLYLDTGMGRLGMPYHRALPWMAEMDAAGGIRVEGTFMAFTETDDFDPEQLARFRAVAAQARDRGVATGALHAASSHGLFHRPDALLDAVRPGLVLFGAYPSGGIEREREWEARGARSAEEARGDRGPQEGAAGRSPGSGELSLRPAHRLRARVVRVTRLRPGDTVSYGRNYVARRPTWAATLPVGHADGYPRRAVEGCRVLIGKRTHPVIGAVSASHTIVEVGPAGPEGTDPPVRVGDVATLVGPDHPDIHPNEVATRAGISVYDVLMHLGARLPVRSAG